MTRPRAFDHDQLMAAAYDVLRRQGPAKLTLRPIAARLGVSQPAVLKRLGSKRALLADMQRWATERTRELTTALRGQPPIAGLRWLFRIHGQQARSPRELAHLTSFAALCLADTRLRALAEARHKLVIDEVAAALRRDGRPHPELTSRVVVALLDGVPLQWAIDPRGSLEAALSEALDLVLAAQPAR
jgi:AcrR family transcriptional regulator